LVKWLLGKKAERKLSQASIFQLHIGSCAVRGAEKQLLKRNSFIWTCLIREVEKRLYEARTKTLPNGP
jgi:hypothetical protein